MTDRADTLLADGSVRILESGSVTRATVVGRGDTYTVTIDRHVSTCTCPHGQHHPYRSRCAHVRAVKNYLTHTRTKGDTVSINRVVISGNLTRDPELRQTAGGLSVLGMRMAVNDRRKNSAGDWEDHPNYVDVTLFGRRGEVISGMVSKGSKIVVEGKLRWSEWESPQGDRRSKLEVVVDEIEIMSGASAQQSSDDEEIPF